LDSLSSGQAVFRIFDNRTKLIIYSPESDKAILYNSVSYNGESSKKDIPINNIKDIQYSDKHKLLFVSTPNKVFVLDFSGNLLGEFNGHVSWHWWNAQFSSGGDSILMVCTVNKCCKWVAPLKRNINQLFELYDDVVYDVVFHDNFFLTLSKNKMAKDSYNKLILWAKDGSKISTIYNNRDANEYINSASFSSDGKRIITVSYSNTEYKSNFREYDLSGNEIFNVEIHGHVKNVFYSGSSDKIWFYSRENKLIFVDKKGKKTEKDYKPKYYKPVTGLKRILFNTALTVNPNDDLVLSLFKIPNNNIPEKIETILVSENYYIVATHDNTFVLLNSEGAILHKENFKSKIKNVVLSQDESYFAISGLNKVQFYRTQKTKCILTKSFDSLNIINVTITPINNYFSIQDSKQTFLYNNSGKLILSGPVMENHNKFEISNDENYIIFKSTAFAEVWDINKRFKINVLKGKTGINYWGYAKFFPDNNYIFNTYGTLYPVIWEMPFETLRWLQNATISQLNKDD